ncbi:MAG: hypothetical protein WBL49_00870, partial [Nitrososphaeraceae archaeon]
MTEQKASISTTSTEISTKTETETETTAYRNFIETCRSPATRLMYSKAIKYFISYLRLPPKAYYRLLAKDPKSIQMDICDYITHLKKSGIVAP